MSDVLAPGDKAQADETTDAASASSAASHQMREVKYVQNIGRFEKGQSVSDATFGPCTLVFGENGWGKSTLADLLRSLTKNNPDILIGRKTLAGGPEQKAVVRFGDQRAVFEHGAWSGIRPRIAVYDSVFVNENVFSGDVVTTEHLKNQYGMVVGEEGVRRVRRIVELDNENRENNNKSRIVEAELDGIVRSVGPEGMTRKEFLTLKAIDDVDAKIEAKEKEVQRASRAKELKGGGEPRPLPVPTETEEFRKSLHSTIEGIAVAAAKAVREHIAKHAGKGRAGAMTHESWLEAGTTFVDEAECAFCGQALDDRTLVDSYAEFFSDAYKTLAADVKARRDTFARYEKGDYRSRAEEIIGQNETLYGYWKEAGQIEPPVLEGVEAALEQMEAAARLLDAVFAKKQGNLTEPATGSDVEAAITAWDEGRKEIVHLNSIVEAHVTKIRALKESVDATELPRLEKELKTLRAAKRRNEDETGAVIEKLEAHEATKKRIAKEKEEEKKELNEHGRMITETLGRTINSYLGRLNAGFKIDYREPNYQGKEPAASYQILINDVPVSPRSTSENLAEASFRNTLSAGDKSTLALALFLAKLNADPELGKTIVVLDDPFTSLDNFRRQFTAIEIRKLCGRAAQTVVLSHDKNFLRLLWEKIDQSTIKCLAIQTGAPGMTTIAPYDIESETRPRHITERMKIEEFVEGEAHDVGYIRTRLRTVCEDFYRRGDPGLFHEAASLEEIIRILDGAPAHHPYKGVVEDLRDINEYSRGEHHAEVEDDPSGESSDEELKGFARRVLDLTRGM
ncbi:MAG: AAA family ATPase [Gammaproteobacteria bacterium]|nr:AAA family ATPase [Gammaproteobacteria bacterium]